MPSQKKIDIVTELSEKTARAKSMVFTNYQGLTHKQLEELKKALKTVDAELVVSKNTLLAKSLANSKLKVQNAKLEGQTATLFAYGDIINPLKELAKSIKLLKLPEIKFGIIDGKETSAADILRLSIIPSRVVLLAQLVGGLSAPVYGLHRALSWNLTKLVLTLKAIEKKKA